MVETPWRKSSRSSGSNNSQCVEARLMGVAAQLSDSKTVETGRVILPVSLNDFQQFIAHVKTGELSG